MKKVIALALALVMCLSIFGCKKANSTKYGEDDFMIYDKEGKVLERPTINNSSLMLALVEEGVTSKQVAVGDDAIESLKSYDLCYGNSVYSEGETLGDIKPKKLTKDVDLDFLIKNSGALLIVLAFDEDYKAVDAMELIANDSEPANMLVFFIEDGKIANIILSSNNFGKEDVSSKDAKGNNAVESEDKSSDEDDSSNDKEVFNDKSFDEESVTKQLAVKKYSYNSRYSNYGFLEIVNNSEFDLEISANVKFYDDSGNLVGAESDSAYAFQKGTTILMDFSADEEFASFEYEIFAEEDDFYECIAKDLSFESVAAKDKEIVTVTNNNVSPAKWVVGAMLFFNGDQIVDYEYTYFSDNDSELKAGKSITEEIHCYEKYDSYKFYLAGHK